jgi:hypothetical protein
MVPTAFYRDLEVVFARKPDRRDHIIGGFTPNDGARAPIVQPVPNLVGGFIFGIRRCNQRTAEMTAEPVKRKMTQEQALLGPTTLACRENSRAYRLSTSYQKP